MLQVIINLVRGKFLLLFFGPESTGITLIFPSSTNPIQKFVSLGLVEQHNDVRIVADRFLSHWSNILASKT